MCHIKGFEFKSLGHKLCVKFKGCSKVNLETALKIRSVFSDAFISTYWCALKKLMLYKSIRNKELSCLFLIFSKKYLEDLIAQFCLL